VILLEERKQTSVLEGTSIPGDNSSLPGPGNTPNPPQHGTSNTEGLVDKNEEHDGMEVHREGAAELKGDGETLDDDDGMHGEDDGTHGGDDGTHGNDDDTQRDAGDTQGGDGGKSDGKQPKTIWQKAHSRFRLEMGKLAISYETLITKEAPGESSMDEKYSKIVGREVNAMSNRYKNRWVRWERSRRIMDKVVKVFLKFEEIGKPVAALDPIHAGIPFAGVCLVFKVSHS
jgi:hypothetical protein